MLSNIIPEDDVIDCPYTVDTRSPAAQREFELSARNIRNLSVWRLKKLEREFAESQRFLGDPSIR